MVCCETHSANMTSSTWNQKSMSDLTDANIGRHKTTPLEPKGVCMGRGGELATKSNVQCMASLNASKEHAWAQMRGTAEKDACTVQRRAVDHTFMPDQAWGQWIWQENPLEETHIDLMLNRMHLLGLLIARYRAVFQVHTTP